MPVQIGKDPRVYKFFKVLYKVAKKNGRFKFSNFLARLRWKKLTRTRNKGGVDGRKIPRFGPEFIHAPRCPFFNLPKIPVCKQILDFWTFGGFIGQNFQSQPELVKIILCTQLFLAPQMLHSFSVYMSQSLHWCLYFSI